MKSKRKVITICGSAKFKDQIIQSNEHLSLKGYVVFSLATVSKEFITEEIMKQLTEIHYQKISMSDAIYVVNVDGYIGEHTRNEINYARSLNKEIMYLQKEK